MDPGYVIQDGNGNWNTELSVLQTWNKSLVDELLLEYNEGGFVYQDHSYQTGEKSLRNIIGTALAASVLVSQGKDLPANFYWRDANNENVPMTAAQMIDFGMAAFSFVSSNYFNAFSHKTNIDALADVQSALDYDITTGWNVTSVALQSDVAKAAAQAALNAQLISDSPQT